MMESLPNAPWKRDPANPMVVADRRGDQVAHVTYLPAERSIATADGLQAAHATMASIAQAIAALPDVITAARAAANLLDTIYPDWTNAQILEAEPDSGPTFIETRDALRQALRRSDGLLPDGNIPPDGTYP